MGSVHDWTALEQSRAIRSGEVSCVELTTHYLDRSRTIGEVVGAFAYLDEVGALARAREIDDRVAAGTVAPDAVLFGCVAPVKDLDLVAGMPCEFGSEAMRGFRPPEDAAFVTRMRQAGLVITGKTVTPEFGLPCYTENDLGHAARTPWNPDLSAGGSSGGAAAAVAARLAPIAQGSDGGGSIRIPASVTGLVGVKPSRGRVSDLPLVPGVGELAVIGPLARTVADAAAFLDVLAGCSPEDLFGVPSPESFLAAARRPPGRLRIGCCVTPMVAESEVDPQILVAVAAAAALLSDLGHDVVDIPPPVSPDVVSAFEAVWWAAAAAIPLPDDAPLTPLTRRLRERGAALTAVDLARAVQTMRMAAVAAIRATADYDVLLMPTLAHLPRPVGHFAARDPDENFAEQKRFTPFTAPFNVTGQPAVSVPFHHTEGGLPVGVQLVGRPRDEVTLLSLAAQLEESVRWHERVPEVAGGRP